MNVSLTPELERLVDAKVKSGLYTSASEVVRDGLRLLKERDDLRDTTLRELRRDLDVGERELNRGEGAAAKGVMERLKRKYRGKRT
jgi:antitoxin ParD1/3/4